MPRVLVVDDEPDLRYMIRLFLEHAGYEVVEAGHGAAALNAVHAAHPDLIVTDMMMPIMGGVELIRQLRSDAATAAIPIIVVSGNSELAGKVEAVLPKPFDPAVLVRTANGLTSKAQV